MPRYQFDCDKLLASSSLCLNEKWVSLEGKPSVVISLCRRCLSPLLTSLFPFVIRPVIFLLFYLQFSPSCCMVQVHRQNHGSMICMCEEENTAVETGNSYLVIQEGT